MEVIICSEDTKGSAAEFQKKYGERQPDGTYVVSASWQSGLSNGALIGEILGLMACGVIAERMGYRFTIALALVLVVRNNDCTLRSG